MYFILEKSSASQAAELLPVSLVLLAISLNLNVQAPQNMDFAVLNYCQPSWSRLQLLGRSVTATAGRRWCFQFRFTGLSASSPWQGRTHNHEKLCNHEVVRHFLAVKKFNPLLNSRDLWKFCQEHCESVSPYPPPHTSMHLDGRGQTELKT